MKEGTITKDDRQCLQFWFRQALAKLETEEATEQFIRNRASLEGRELVHHEPIVRRASRRKHVDQHTHVLAHK